MLGSEVITIVILMYAPPTRGGGGEGTVDLARFRLAFRILRASRMQLLVIKEM